MTVNVSKPAINVREKLAELDKPTGIAGEAMLRAETPQEQFNLIGAGRRNILINGDMRIAQAGTSITTIGTGSYQACDRWRIQTNLNQTTHTWAQVADAPEGFKYSAKLTVGTGVTPTGGDYGRVYQRIEVQDAEHLQWGTSKPQPITLSFWVKASIAGKYGGTFAANGTGVYMFSYHVNSANTWEYKTYTVTDGMTTFGTDSNDNGIGFGVHFDLGEGPSRSSSEGPQPTNNSGSMGLTDGIKILATSGATWQITGVQLELGKVATPFEHRSYGEELAACQRYYQTVSIGRYKPISFRGSNGNVADGPDLMLPTPMRATPTAGGGVTGVNTAYWGSLSSTSYSTETNDWAAAAVSETAYKIRLSNASSISNNELTIRAPYGANITGTFDAEL